MKTIGQRLDAQLERDTENYLNKYKKEIGDIEEQNYNEQEERIIMNNEQRADLYKKLIKVMMDRPDIIKVSFMADLAERIIDHLDALGLVYLARPTKLDIINNPIKEEIKNE